MNRFEIEDDAVIDRQTGLMWTRNATVVDLPLSWNEAFKKIKDLNKSALCGYRDWKVPNRKELFSLMSHETFNPSLPAGHPFTNVFTGYYWTSTTCARLPNQAWYVHLGGARVFKGMKHGSYMVWPVRTIEGSNKSKLFQTGQKKCFDEGGAAIDCLQTGQDGDIQAGRKFTTHRFREDRQLVHDNATGLTWLRDANVFKNPVDWATAADLALRMNNKMEHGHNDWRVPSIVELESLTDMGRHSPALPDGHPFRQVQEFYWSSTTSMYDRQYSWVLYMIDGAVGVGYKSLSDFYVWPVRGDSKICNCEI